MSLQLGLPLLAAAALLQATVLPHLRVFGGQPDLVVVIVLAWATLDHDREGMVWAFVGGLLVDLLSGMPLGVSSVILTPIAWVVGLTEAQVYRSPIIVPLLLMAGGALVYHLAYLLILQLITGSVLPWADSLLYVTLPSVLFDLVLMVPTLFILQRWYNKLHPRRVTL